MRFPIISEGQESARLLAMLPESAVIGWVGDYDMNMRDTLNDITLSNMRRMPTVNGKKGIYFSIMTAQLESPEFVDLKTAMYNSEVCSVVYDLEERFPSFLHIEYNRLYYTRHEIGKTDFKTSDVFPKSKSGDAPDAVIERGEAGMVIAYEKAGKLAEMEKTYKYPSQSEYQYLQHIDFILYFDFNRLNDFKNALADKKWSGALLTILNWGVREQETMGRDWRDSSEWLRVYSPYHCPRREMLFNEKMALSNDNPLYVHMPKTSEWHERVYGKQEVQRNDVYAAADNNDNIIKENNNINNAYYNTPYKNSYNRVNISYNKEYNIKTERGADNNNNNNGIIPRTVHEDSLPSP